MNEPLEGPLMLSQTRSADSEDLSSYPRYAPLISSGVLRLARRSRCDQRLPAISLTRSEPTTQEHLVGSGNRQTPLVAVALPVTQRAGGTHKGPVSVLHAIPSLASATQVPGVVPCAPIQVEALVQSTTTWFTKPQAEPAVT